MFAPLAPRKDHIFMTVYDYDDSIARALGLEPHTVTPLNVQPPYLDSTSVDPVAISLADVASRSVGWVWPGWIPSGMLTILGGHVGDGKSTVIAALVAALTSGEPLPDGTVVDPLNVLILGHEDDPSRVLRPRLDANHADLDRIFLIDPTSRTRHDLRTDAWWLTDVIRENDIGLVIIDPLGEVLRRSDRASEGDIRTELEPLMKVIEATGVAVVGVMRVGKGISVRRPAQGLVGSSAIPAIARSVIMIAPTPEPEAPTRAILQVVKSNASRAPQPVALDIDGSGVVAWLGSVEEGIDERLGDPRLGTSERREAGRFLRELLAGGPMPATLVLRQARNVGF
jgi:putative DNA primase/helicase